MISPAATSSCGAVLQGDVEPWRPSEVGEGFKAQLSSTFRGAPACRSTASRRWRHVGLLVAAHHDQEEREDQPEPAVRGRLEGGVQPGALRDGFQAAGEGDLDRAAVVHRPAARPVERHGLQLDERAACPLRPVPRAHPDRALGQLLHAAGTWGSTPAPPGGRTGSRTPPPGCSAGPPSS